MKRTGRKLGWSGVLVLLGMGQGLAQYQVVHNFAGGPTDGSTPMGTLLVVGTNLFGMTYSGGSAGLGVVASDLGVLHSFAGSPGDGAGPTFGTLALSGTHLFGMTQWGGTAGSGVLFKVSTSGAGYAVLHHFTGTASDGSRPVSTPTIIGTKLYGSTGEGGASNLGTLFSINTDGSGYAVLHHFAPAEGGYPYASPILCGDALYGTTMGTIYRLNLDGSGFTNLVVFSEPTGVTALSGLVPVGDTFFGVTEAGGISNKGVIYKVDTNGGHYTVLHHFTGVGSDGHAPRAAPTVLGAMLYGTTEYGGLHNLGTLYKICTNGTGFTTLHSLAGGLGDGGRCPGGLALLDTTLYGMAMSSGSNGHGVVYGLMVVGPKLFYQEPAGTLASWILETNGLFQMAYVLGNTGGWLLKAAGDIDGDGVADLLFQTASHDTGGWFMGGDGKPINQRFWWNTGDWEIRGCADYDADGYAEIFFQRPDGTAAYWDVATNGDFQSATVLGAMGAWQLRAAGDLDGDNKAEVFWQQATGLVAVWFHDGPGGSIRGQLMGNTGGWQLRGAADIDQDGITDLVWQTAAGLTGGWFMKADATAKAASFWWGTGSWRLSGAGAL